MGILDRLKKGNNTFEKMSKDMGKDLIKLYSEEIKIPFSKTTELERQVLAVYFFGMTNGLMQQFELEKTPSEVAENIKNNFVEVFNYSNTQAQSFLDSIIENLQSKDPKNTQYVIIHKGLDGYFAWKEDKKDSVIKEVCQMINSLKGA